MSNYKGHLSGGAIGFVLVVSLCSLHVMPCEKLIEWLICVLAGSLFPDIDIKSKGQKIFYALLVGLMLICLVHNNVYAMAYLALGGMLPLLVKHRGIFHHLWFLVLLVVFGAYVLTVQYPTASQRIAYDACFFMLGIVSHLYLDVGLKRMLQFSR